MTQDLFTPSEQKQIDSHRGRTSFNAFIHQSVMNRIKKMEKATNKKSGPANQEYEAAIKKFLNWFCKRYEGRFKCKYVVTVRHKQCPDRDKIIELLGLSDQEKEKATKWIVERFFQDEFYIRQGCKLYLYSHNSYHDEAWAKKVQAKKKDESKNRIVNLIPTQRVSPLARSEEQRQKELAAHG